MKQVVYPIVLYLDELTSCYTVAFQDLDLYTEGDTVEEAFLKAEEFLAAYFDCLVEFHETPEEASRYLEVLEKHKGEIVLLTKITLNE